MLSRGQQNRQRLGLGQSRASDNLLALTVANPHSHHSAQFSPRAVATEPASPWGSDLRAGTAAAPVVAVPAAEGSA